VRLVWSFVEGLDLTALLATIKGNLISIPAPPAASKPRRVVRRVG
jgi:hypothetical protein